MIIPYTEITENADRRWTSRLLERLLNSELPDDERGDLVATLQAVSDPRSVDRLDAILTDVRLPLPAREAASAVLGGMHHQTVDVPEGTLRRWWLEGDALLRRHALSCMGGIDCPDIVLQVASDPSHEFYAQAIGQMMFNFDLPDHQRIKINALSHPDPRVRAVAASVLLFDEPVAAEGPLLGATHDSTPEVVAEATNTLQYYPSLKVMRRLHELLGHADANVREEAKGSFDSIRDELLTCLRDGEGNVAQAVHGWLRPVWDVLAFSEEDLLPEEPTAKSTKQTEPKEAVPLASVQALLEDADASPLTLSSLLWSNDWSSYGTEERRRLRPLLLTHPDHLVRERAALCFALWQDVEGLLELVRDRHFLVRKSAMYWLGQLPPTCGVANTAWEHLGRQDVQGVTGIETLDTFVRHAEPSMTVSRLACVAGDHGRREELRVAAICHLARLEAVNEVGQLAGQLLEPPTVTWALHIALLQALSQLSLPPPDIAHLMEVDNLHVQVAVRHTVPGAQGAAAECGDRQPACRWGDAARRR